MQSVCARGERSLGAIGVWAGIGHGQDAWAHVHQLKVLILELGAIDAAPSGAVVLRKVLQWSGYNVTLQLCVCTQWKDRTTNNLPGHQIKKCSALQRHRSDRR